MRYVIFLKEDVNAPAHHREEDAKLRVHLYVISISKDEVLAPFFLAGEHNGNLLSRH